MPLPWERWRTIYTDDTESFATWEPVPDTPPLLRRAKRALEQVQQHATPVSLNAIKELKERAKNWEKHPKETADIAASMWTLETYLVRRAMPRPFTPIEANVVAPQFQAYRRHQEKKRQRERERERSTKAVGARRAAFRARIAARDPLRERLVFDNCGRRV